MVESDLPRLRWYALASGGKYPGQVWEQSRSTFCRARAALVTLDRATICFGLQMALEEARQGRETLGLDFCPVVVDFEGSGKDTRVRVQGGEWSGTSGLSDVLPAVARPR